jgi:hypothetical protein
LITNDGVKKRNSGAKERRREEAYLSLVDITVGWVATAFEDQRGFLFIQMNNKVTADPWVLVDMAGT